MKAFKKLVAMIMTIAVCLGIFMTPTVLSRADENAAEEGSGENATAESTTTDETSSEEITTRNMVYPLPGRTVHQHYNNPGAGGRVITSYLTEIDDEVLMRTQLIEDQQLLIEYWTRKGDLLSGKTKTLQKELEFFLGFYAGADAYYLAYGADNKEEKDESVVLRIVKYDKDWKRLSACDLKGINTCRVSDSGAFKMEEYYGILYIHTCHTMYKDEDGKNPQANMTLEINEADMTVKNSFTDLLDRSAGCVSNSDNQFIRIRDGLVYRLDYGSGEQKEIILSAYPADGEMTEPVVCETIAKFSGKKIEDYLGVVLGDFEVSDTGVIAAYTQGVSRQGLTSNIKICYWDSETGKTEKRDITHFYITDDEASSYPRLVKLPDGNFLLLWMEMKIGNIWGVRMADVFVAKVLLDNKGQVISDVVKDNYMLSECMPILTSDGMVSWYQTAENLGWLYLINPYITEDDYFRDVQNPKDWFYEKVYEIADTKNAKGSALMSGYKNGTHTFGPADPLTRQDFAVILYRLAEEPAVSAGGNPFPDADKNGYYYDSILWAKTKNVIKGYDSGNFGVGDNITREQVATILYRYAKDYLKIDTEPAKKEGSGKLKNFKDSAAVSNFAKDALAWAVGAGVITGKADGRIDPQGNAARAEIGTMVLRFLKWSDGI